MTLIVVLAAGCSSSARPSQRSLAAQQRREGVTAGRALRVGRGTDKEVRVPVLRLGLMADAADAAVLAGVERGSFSLQLGTEVRLEPVGYVSAVAESRALASGKLDAACVDPVAAIAAWQALAGRLRIMSGAGAGGAELVARRNVTSARQLTAGEVAAPAASGQAVALGSWVRGHGAAARVEGTMASSGEAAVAAFRAGRVAAALEPAPFDVQMVAAGGHVLASEDDLWPGGRPATAVLAVTSAFLSAHRAEVTDLLKGQVLATQLVNTDRAAAQTAARAELARLLRRRLPGRVLAKSLAQVTFTNDPLASSVLAEARLAAAAGMIRPVGSLAGLFELGPLNRLLRAAGQAPVPG